MGLFNKLTRMKTLLTVGLIAFFCAVIYYFAVSRSWSNDNTFIHVDIDTFPDSHQPPNQEREVEIVPPSPIDNSRGSNENVQNPLNEDKIDVKWPPESEIHPVSGEGIKDKKDPNQENGGKLKEGEKGGEDEREGAERPVADGDDQGMFISQLTEAGMTGMLNYDIWRWIVGYTVDDMRIDKSYPSSPDERKTINRLHVEFNEEDPEDIKGKYSHKVYGYLLPPTPGKYRFSIEMSDVTAAGCVELWLSTDNDPLNMRKVLVLDYDDMSRPMPRRATYIRLESEDIQMDSSAHYFEYIQKTYEGKVVVDIKWRQPNSEEFVEMDFRTFAMAAKFDSEDHLTDGPAVKVLQGRLPSDELQAHQHVRFVGDTIYPIADINVLPACQFKPAYAQPRRVKKYNGVYQVHESRVYPKDMTWFHNWHKKDKGNQEISRETVDKIISLYSKAFNASKKYKGNVVKLRYMEETTNRNLPTKAKKNPDVHGSRFLIEFDIQLLEPEKELVHTSEYVYLAKGSSELCHTSNYQWKKSPTVDVYFVVSLKNLGPWVEHLIHNMEDLYAKTKDDHFELVLVDYESQDMNVEERLKTSSINRWHYVKKSGPFSRSGGLQAGIDYVTNPDSIVMTIDMHLTLPPGFVEYIRRHTIQGKMVCTPFFFRLNKGYTEINFNGFWETLTYGMFSMFKSDWTKFGGFDLIHYKDKWGGEDWDILDRSLAQGYEAFRIRYPGLVHYHHTKAGMWITGGAKGRPKRR